MTSRISTTFLVTLMMAFCLSLAYFVFSSQSLRLDEAQSLWQVDRSPGQIFNIIGKDVHVPLYHLILHFWQQFFGNTVEIGRLMSLLLYLASIPAIYFVGKLAYNRSVGLFAALLLAISPFMNWYGSEIRMYTLFTFVTILNQYFFIRLFKKPSDHVWVGYAATVLLGVFTHYFFFLNLSAQVVFYFTRRSIFPRESLRRFIITALLVGVAFTPWILYVAKLGEVVSQEPHLTTPTAVNLFSTFSQFLFGFQDDHLNTFFLSLWPITIGLGLLTLRRTRIAPETEYFLSTILISIGVAFIVSFIQPIFVSRYMIFTIPSLYLLLSSIFSVYPERIAIWARALLVGVMAFSLILEITNPSSPVKEDYRGAVAYLTNNAKPQDVVVVSAPFTIYPVEYYYRGAAPLYTLPLWDRYAYGPIPAFSSTTMPQEVTQITREHQEVWLLLSYDQGYEKNIKNYFDTHFERVTAKNFSPDLNLYAYKLRYDTPLSGVFK